MSITYVEQVCDGRVKFKSGMAIQAILHVNSPSQSQSVATGSQMCATHPLRGSAMRKVLLLTLMAYGHRIRNVRLRAGCYWSHCSGSCFFASRLVLAGSGWSRIFPTSGRFRSRGLVHCWSLTERSYQQVSAGEQQQQKTIKLINKFISIGALSVL